HSQSFFPIESKKRKNNMETRRHPINQVKIQHWSIQSERTVRNEKHKLSPDVISMLDSEEKLFDDRDYAKCSSLAIVSVAMASLTHLKIVEHPPPSVFGQERESSRRCSLNPRRAQTTAEDLGDKISLVVPSLAYRGLSSDTNNSARYSQIRFPDTSIASLRSDRGLLSRIRSRFSTFVVLFPIQRRFLSTEQHFKGVT
ncbi:unnamed protein product, partial [Heterotrigona itama]